MKMMFKRQRLCKTIELDPFAIIVHDYVEHLIAKESLKNVSTGFVTCMNWFCQVPEVALAILGGIHCRRS